MGVIKSVLKEELENSLRLKKEYEKELRNYPGGSFIKKDINGHKYYYLAVRMGKKVKFIYKGKKLARKDIAELNKSKEMRKKYKQQIRKLRERISYLRRALSGKEDV